MLVRVHTVRSGRRTQAAATAALLGLAAVLALTAPSASRAPGPDLSRRFPRSATLPLVWTPFVLLAGLQR